MHLRGQRALFFGTLGLCLVGCDPGKPTSSGARRAPIADRDSDTALREFMHPVNELRGRLSMDDLTALLQRLRAQPDYVRITTCLRLANTIALRDRFETDLYVDNYNQHDLRVLGGRAAFMLDQLLDIRLPAVRAETDRDKLEHIRSKALASAFVFKENTIEKHKSDKVASLRELKAKFHGKIIPGVDPEKYFVSAKAFEQLLDNWFPIGKKFVDLEEIIGRPGEHNSEYLFQYSFGDGFALGHGCWFFVEDGVIRYADVVSGFE